MNFSPGNFPRPLVHNRSRKKFRDKVTLYLQAKQLSNLFPSTEAIRQNNRYYFFFDEQIAKDTLTSCQDKPQEFLSTYKKNLTTELFKNCEIIEITDGNGKVIGKAYNIEQLNNDKEHDNLQIRRLQNLAGSNWCTCYESKCQIYLDNANSFIFIPNDSERI